ncbi:MAG: hypothetical protein WD066_03700 [Planctomycetaceae bacterium]
MRRPSIVRYGAVAAACLLAGCLLTGCGAAQKTGPFAWIGFGRSQPAAVARKNPLRRSDDASRSRADDDRAASRAEAVAHLDSGDEPNPETLALLEREFADATPEERRDYAGLAELPPDVAAQILRTRRLGLQRDSESGSDTRLASAVEEESAREEPPPLGDASPGSPVREPADGLRISGGSGLGNASPWGRENPAVLDPHLQPLDGPGIRSAARPPTDDGFGHSTSHGKQTSPGAAAGQPRSGHGHPIIAHREPGSNEATAGRVAPERGANEPEWDAQPLEGRPPEPEPPVPPPIANALPGAAGDPSIERFGPIPDPRSADWDAELQRLIARAESRIATATLGGTDAERNEYIRRHVHLRLLYLMSGQQGRAIVAIPGIEPADQEFWMQAIWALNDYFDQSRLPDKQDRAAQAVAQLRTAIRKLQEQASLDLRNVTFCHKISSFGNYERFDRDEFNPGQPVLLYAEVANFASETTGEGQYRTMLKSTIEIYKAGRDGDLVEQLTFPATEDLCRNHRQDYFHSYEFTIPARASLGPHVVKLTVEDQLSRKLATYSVNFTVR